MVETRGLLEKARCSNWACPKPKQRAGPKDWATHVARSKAFWQMVEKRGLKKARCCSN